MKKTFYIFLTAFFLLNVIILFNLTKKVYATENLFRFQVIANSNTSEDQDIKEKIKDKILKYIQEKNIDEISITQSDISDILNLTNDYLTKYGFDYFAYAKYGKVYTEEKTNNYILLPEGSYKSLQIILGEGKGKNFWSLIFPTNMDMKKLEPLETILPGISKMYLENDLSKEKTENISIYEDETNEKDNTKNIESNKKDYSFKILELLNIK